jgi:uncharacterized coiled-coil protein SlyX
LKARDRDLKIEELESRVASLESTLSDLTLLLTFLCKSQESITDTLENLQSKINQKHTSIFMTKKVDDLIN